MASLCETCAHSVLPLSTRIEPQPASRRGVRLSVPPPPGLLATKSCVLTRASSRVDGAGTRVTEDPDRTKDEAGEISQNRSPGGGPSRVGIDSDEEVSSLMEGVSFADLCDDFECVSSPAVERTARLLARDIHDIREDKRTLTCFAVNSKYKDPLRSFTGREKYRRLSWILTAINNPRVDMLSMEMLSTSVLVIKWRLRGGFRVMPAADLLGVSLDLLVTSTFTLNQISGQVLEHRDEWDLSRCGPQATLIFYSSRLAWTTVQASKDLSEGVSKVGAVLDKSKGQDTFIYPDPSGDPRKFFAQDDPNRESYQFAFAVALVYLLVQFLRQVI